jgi:hypothetical protein
MQDSKKIAKEAKFKDKIMDDKMVGGVKSKK